MLAAGEAHAAIAHRLVGRDGEALALLGRERLVRRGDAARDEARLGCQAPLGAPRLQHGRGARRGEDARAEIRHEPGRVVGARRRERFGRSEGQGHHQRTAEGQEGGKPRPRSLRTP